MTQMTPAQSRIINPILTTHAQGYVRPGNVGRLLFPIAFVSAYGGQRIEFGKESFRRYNTKRAPGANSSSVTFGYAGQPYAIVPRSLDAVVPREIMNDASQVPGLDLATDAVDLVLDVMDLDHEYDCAAIARNASNYDTDHKVALVGAARWAGGSADPMGDVKTGRESVRESIGVRPNIAILSPSAFSACEEHPDIVDRIKHTGRDAVTTEILAKLWKIERVEVAEAVGASGAADDFGDIWGNDVILAYVSPPTGGNRRSAARPSFGYTYAMQGHPLVEKPYWDPGRRSWVYGVSADREPVLTGVTAGYLIQNAGAPAA
ncbi:MAG TPA: hypothetical protein VGE64_03710 [Xanthomonadaceae bacterium]